MRAIPDGVTDRAIEARSRVLAAAADELCRRRGGAESRVRLSKTNRYDFGVVSAATHKSMQGNKRRDTKPEVLVRRMLREMGFPGYRCDWRKAPGRPDVAFVGRKLAIEIAAASGIGVPCAACRCPRRTSITGRLSSPATSSATSKTWRLEAAGWKVLVLWEHQLKKKRAARHAPPSLRIRAPRGRPRLR